MDYSPAEIIQDIDTYLGYLRMHRLCCTVEIEELQKKIADVESQIKSIEENFDYLLKERDEWSIVRLCTE